MAFDGIAAADSEERVNRAEEPHPSSDLGRKDRSCSDSKCHVGRSNALVQLQAHLTVRAQRAIQKWLSAATFVRRQGATVKCHRSATALNSPHKNTAKHRTDCGAQEAD
jgi:hypothetical protein